MTPKLRLYAMYVKYLGAYRGMCVHIPATYEACALKSLSGTLWYTHTRTDD